MSLVTYPKSVPTYAGYVSELRVHLNRLVSFVQSRSGAKATVGAQVDAALAAINYVSVLPANKYAVSNGQVLVIGPKTFTFTVAGGVITAIGVSP